MGKKTRTLNPADAHRKAQRQRELKKNKAERVKTREITLVKKDTKSLEADIRRLTEQERKEGTLSASAKSSLESLRAELARVKKAKAEYVEKHPEHRKFVYKDEDRQAEGSGSGRGGGGGRGGPLFGQDGKLRDPTRSVYYHPVLNPFGNPPPGMPYLEKPPEPGQEVPSFPDDDEDDGEEEDEEDISDEDNEEDEKEGEKEEEDEDIPLPEGPPPAPPEAEGGDDSDDSDDDIPMPEGPPPGVQSGDAAYAARMAMSQPQGPFPPRFPPNFMPPHPGMPMLPQGMQGNFPPPPFFRPHAPLPPPHFQPQFQPQFQQMPPPPPPGFFPSNAMPTFGTGMRPPRGPKGRGGPMQQHPHSVQDPLSDTPHQTYQAYRQNRGQAPPDSAPPLPEGPPPPPRPTASATIVAAPQLRDLKAEATAFVPAAMRKKKGGAGGGVGANGSSSAASAVGLTSGSINAAPESGKGVEEEDRPAFIRPSLMASLKGKGVIGASSPESEGGKKGNSGKDDYDRFLREMGDIL